MTHAWFTTEDGRQVYRRVPEPPRERSAFPCPMFMRDEMDQPLKSMADGKMYTSKSAMRASYRPSGNPQGNSYVEVGDQHDRPYTPPATKIDDKQIDTALNKALARYQAGERPA